MNPAPDSTDNSPVRIRPEVGGDHAIIGSVVAAAFGRQVEADLVERIRASDVYVPELALVAETATDSGDRVVGHVMVSGAVLKSEHGGERAIKMLSPLAVDPDWQRRGIGGELVRAVAAEADRLGEPFVILEGSPDYYSRFGFQPAASFGVIIPLPDWAPPEAGQLLALSRFDPHDPGLAGRVVYPPAFDGLD